MTKKTITILEITRREILNRVFDYAKDIYLCDQQETNIEEILAYTTALSTPSQMKRMLNDISICPAICFDIGAIEELELAKQQYVVRILNDDAEALHFDGTPSLWLELKSDEIGQW